MMGGAFLISTLPEHASLPAHEQLKSFFIVGEFLEPFFRACHQSHIGSSARFSS